MVVVVMYLHMRDVQVGLLVEAGLVRLVRLRRMF